MRVCRRCMEYCLLHKLNSSTGKIHVGGPAFSGQVPPRVVCLEEVPIYIQSPGTQSLGEGCSARVLTAFCFGSVSSPDLSSPANFMLDSPNTRQDRIIPRIIAYPCLLSPIKDAASHSATNTLAPAGHPRQNRAYE
ncbi:hypothetical protein ACRALDRAFT_205341 [Sodiomyces alcalophilus JCM 7366]|uniref:uncharacterized protein n=1 Tax=Sodiomyces alcalophilus JCM 7366 TaxID=591952 RepID=UPI0039B4AE8B